MIKIGIFQAGSVPKELSQKFPSYPEMIMSCFSINKDEWEFDNFKILNNIFPENLKHYDGFIITGSAYGVYENISWINNLFRKILKMIVPQKQRQIIRNKIKNFNKEDFVYLQLSEEKRRQLFEKYFRKDIIKLENLIGKKMNWN